jgi:hypothetical protein
MQLLENFTCEATGYESATHVTAEVNGMKIMSEWVKAYFRQILTSFLRATIQFHGFLDSFMSVADFNCKITGTGYSSCFCSTSYHY